MHKKEFRELICACLLGDGFISVNKTRGSFGFAHSSRQYDYLKWKTQLIDQIFIDKNLPRRFRTYKINHHLSNGKSYEAYHAVLSWKDYFHLLHKKFYKAKDKSKRLENILKQIYSPLHLAIILCDDGSEVRRRSKHVDGTKYYCNPHYRIDLGNCTDGESTLFVDWLKYNFKIEPKKFKSSRGYWVIWFRAKDSKKVFQLIESYLNQIPSMQDKFWLSFLKYKAVMPKCPTIREDIVHCQVHEARFKNNFKKS